MQKRLLPQVAMALLTVSLVTPHVEVTPVHAAISNSPSASQVDGQRSEGFKVARGFFGVSLTHPKTPDEIRTLGGGSVVNWQTLVNEDLEDMVRSGELGYIPMFRTGR